MTATITTNSRLRSLRRKSGFLVAAPKVRPPSSVGMVMEYPDGLYVVRNVKIGRKGPNSRPQVQPVSTKFGARKSSKQKSASTLSMSSDEYDEDDQFEQVKPRERSYTERDSRRISSLLPSAAVMTNASSIDTEVIDIHSTQFYDECTRVAHELSMILTNIDMTMSEVFRDYMTELKTGRIVENKNENGDILFTMAEWCERLLSSINISDQLIFALYSASAEQGYHRAEAKLGAVYEHGQLHQHRDLTLSVRWYITSAKHGNPDGQLATSDAYRFGIPGIVDQNYRNAYIWALKSASTGHPAGLYAVASCIEHQIGVGYSQSMMFENYIKAYRAGDLPAKVRLQSPDALFAIETDSHLQLLYAS
ncbi:hypothetical protein V1512DRAFT_265348 [Lipomyces arxii]|uniref:uncharacterized protein n=1 Tax=Lipomyces arxii TaxID=56418 RepID=UPI0034CFAC3C